MASVEERREKYFDEWDTAMNEGDYQKCDLLKDKLLITLSPNSEVRLKLQQYIQTVDGKYNQDLKDFDDALKHEPNPLSRDKMKQILPHEEEWRTKTFFDKFFSTFSQESLIEKEK